jgi:hypothetical protein
VIRKKVARFGLVWLAIALLVAIGVGTIENGIILTSPVYGYLMIFAVFGAPVGAYLLVTRRDVDVRRLWLFVGVVYVLGLGPYALFQAYPLLSTFIVGLALRAGALVGVLAGAYYLVYERRVGERMTA